jgi:protein TonB
MLCSFGQAHQAISLLKATLKDMPENVHVRLKLKDIYLRCDMPSEAADQYLHIARIYNERGDTERAKDYIVRARRLNSTSEPLSGPPQAQRSSVGQQAEPTPGIALSEEGATGAGAAVSDPVSGGGTAGQPTVRPVHYAPSPHPPVKPVELPPLMDKPDVAEGKSQDLAIKSSPSPIKVTTPQSIEPPASPARPDSNREAPSAQSVLFNSSPIKAMRNRRRYALMIGVTCLALLIAAAVLGMRAYDAHLDREYETLVAAMAMPELAEPPPPDTSEGEYSVEEYEGASITVPLNPAATQPSQEESQRPNDRTQEVYKTAQLTAPEAIKTPTESGRPTQTPPALSPISPDYERNNYRDSASPTISLPQSGPLPEPPAPKQELRKTSQVIAGRILRRVEPEYPPIAKQARVTGTVVVEVSVDEQGNVSSARVQSGPQPLRAASVAAAMRWKFQPSTLNGAPVRTISRLVFNFK